jgi:hypothetical protein
MPGCQAVMFNGRHCRNYARKNGMTCCYSHRYLENVPAEIELKDLKNSPSQCGGITQGAHQVARARREETSTDEAQRADLTSSRSNPACGEKSARLQRLLKRSIKKEKCLCSYSKLEKTNSGFFWKCPCGLTSEPM